jgi:hypothetical protein
MIHNLFPNEVYLEPTAHKYFDGQGNEYISFSALYGRLVKKFDADVISRNIARGTGECADDIQAGWNQKTLNGTRVDNALEVYAQTATLPEDDSDLLEMVQSVLAKYGVYHRTYEQVVVYSKEYRVAGSIDKSCIVSNRKDSRFHKGDFKCFEGGEEALYAVKSAQKWLNPPFDHLPNNRYTKVSFQLSFYSTLFEELTGRKCERQFIDLIIPKWDKYNKLVSFENKVIPIQFIKHDIKLFLETFKDDILDQLNNTINSPYTEEFEF